MRSAADGVRQHDDVLGDGAVVPGTRVAVRLRICRYTAVMTRTLDAAIAKLAALPPEEQDRVGRWLLDQLADEEHWMQRFEASQSALAKLAAEARAERTSGQTTDVDPDNL
jgi:hypothetical protein